ncbi:putative CDC45-related protein [Paratrimastix pyriformis]|uniref:CDC45-related protein n=1 Tax=Paratrimastix pyriformis TaxID=342808 RepID=A0ABQ8UJC9_9EUKA|nr:putative CDC45-related protein [Paratrimastix pyriformis]
MQDRHHKSSRCQAVPGKFNNHRVPAAVLACLIFEHKQLIPAARTSSLLIFASPDVDALCACRVLTTLLQMEGIQYHLVAVSTFDDLSAGFHSFSGQLVVLLNLGAIVNIAKFFQPHPDVRFLVVDSHRPYDIANIESPSQVVLVDDGSGEELFHRFTADVAKMNEEVDRIVAEEKKKEAAAEEAGDGDEAEEDAEAEEEDDGGGWGEVDSAAPGAAGRKHGLARDARTRRKRTRLQEAEKESVRPTARPAPHRWAIQQERNIRTSDLERAYYGGTYYGSSVAGQLFNLARNLGKSSNEILWYGILGVTDQLLHERITMDAYRRVAEDLKVPVFNQNTFGAH